MEKEDLKGKRKLEDVYEIQVAANNQHEDAMMTMEWANNYDYDNQEHLSDEDQKFLSELLAEGINDYNYQELPADQDLQSLGDCQNNDVPAIQYLRELPPGFLFCPSDQELLSMYLMPKILHPDLKFEAMPFIPDVNVYEFHPEKLLERYQDKSGYFFTERTKRHANGKDPIELDRQVRQYRNWEKNGLVFHTGTTRDNKSSTKTNWLMKEYHIPGNELTLCRIYLNQ
ncbi:hypothetical protein MKW92_032688 [Papaver armeniacum]|nr:hypothetical protein MKW92_032688 [Papaver armeniacum]